MHCSVWDVIIHQRSNVKGGFNKTNTLASIAQLKWGPFWGLLRNLGIDAIQDGAPELEILRHVLWYHDLRIVTDFHGQYFAIKPVA